jgi:hypothetical protein
VATQRFGKNASALDPGDRISSTSAADAEAEASVRQLLASGDHRAALDRAKEFHKTQGSAASESLLVDAYTERIRSLIRRNLPLEAKSLLELVRQRYPSARKRLDELSVRVAARGASLDALLQPLNNPDLDAAQRAAIDRALQQEVCDLEALAGCDALHAEHPVRQAASALERAFIDATTGPVGEETTGLSAVSHRSPLAPWKLLVRAIASFYRGEDDACQRYLAGINPDSAPARLVPAIRTLIAGDAALPLTPAAAALTARISAPSSLRSALEVLDQAFASGDQRRILKAIRPAVDACRQLSPDRIESLRQHISVRCAVADLDPAKVVTAMGGPSRHDATFLRLWARALEESRDPEKVVLACRLWDEFRHAAVQEGWFDASGPEAAALALHMAGLLREVPERALRDLQHSARSQREAGGDRASFLFPEELYQRACSLDPHPEAFSQWMEWAARQSGRQAERVAAAWHKIRPRDIEPVLRLLKDAEASRSFGSALGYLAKIEQIDRLHPVVRAARFRLLAGSAIRHLEQKKVALVATDLSEMAALPEARHGDRPALLAALRFVTGAVRGNDDETAASRVDVERLLENRAAAAMLIFSVAKAARHAPLARLRSIEEFPSAERLALPGALARVAALAAEMHLKVEMPRPWLTEATRQFPASRHTIDLDHLCALAEVALQGGHRDLPYAISAAGLERGGATEARFLFIRARSVTEPIIRRVVCAKAAAELARHQQDTQLVAETVEFLRGFFEFEALSLTLDQARVVLQKERAASQPPTRRRPGPDYQHLVPQCQCAECRRRRGETVEPFADFDLDDEDFEFEPPPGMPPEIAEVLLEEAAAALRRGESLEDFMARVLVGGPPRPRRKKRKRR